jgi:hypothetical protein
MLTITRGYLVLVQSSSISLSIHDADESHTMRWELRRGRWWGTLQGSPFLWKTTWPEGQTGPGQPQRPTRTEGPVPLGFPQVWALQWVRPPVVCPRRKFALPAAGSALSLRA